MYKLKSMKSTCTLRNDYAFKIPPNANNQHY